MSDALSESLRWALALGTEPERAMVDWLAHELVPEVEDAVEAITRPAATTEADRMRLELLKSGFKSLRVGAESAADRSLAARCYAATIAAGIVRHGVWITRQRPERAIEAIRDLADAPEIAEALRALGTDALAHLDERIVPRVNDGTD